MFLRSVLNRSPISGGHPVLREAVMKTFYEFRSEADPDLHAFTDEVSGSKLPSENGPWTFIRQLASEGEWPSGIKSGDRCGRARKRLQSLELQGRETNHRK